MNNQISLLIAEKGQSLIKDIIPQVTKMAEKAGIKNIGTPNEMMPDSCLVNSELQKMLNLRNQLLTKLNSSSDTVSNLNKITQPLNDTINKSEKALTIAQGVEKGILLGLQVSAIPVPGPILSSLVTTNNLVNNILPPIITTSKNKVNSISNSTDTFDKILKKLNDLLKSIDNYLKNCGIEEDKLTPLNKNAQTAVTNVTKQQLTGLNNGELYFGFKLEIETEPFTPTVNKRRAVAKNSQGIVIIATPYSFTTLDNILVEELKLIINSNNLKAD